MERHRLRQPSSGHRFDFDDVVYGIHAIDETLAAGERLRSIHSPRIGRKTRRCGSCLARAKDLAVTVRFEPRAFFTKLPFKAHQGIVAIAPPFSYASLQDVLFGEKRGARRLVIVLDHLTDPHNVGAMVERPSALGPTA